jgi:hypothetical protein
MAQIRPRDLLTDGLLARLGGTSPYASALAGQVLAGSAPAGIAPAASASAPVPGAGSSTGPDIAAVLRRDIARLGDVDYLKVALPPEFGGLGCTLRQAACGQRRLARHAPLTSCSRPPGARSSRPGTAGSRPAATSGWPTRSRGASPLGRAATAFATRPCSPP